MKLWAKWFLWFSAIGVYVVFLGAIFYYNLFKWTFDEKLKQESVDMIRLYAPTLVSGLSRNPGAISMDEFDTITRVAKDERVVNLIYLNKYGEVRWYKDASKITMPYDQFKQEVPLPTDAIEAAWLSKAPVVRAVASLPHYDIAIPLQLRGDMLGILNMEINREGAVKVIRQAMGKYFAGAVAVLLLMGIPLYFFLHNWVINPLLNFRDAVEGISFKNLELKFSAGGDEIGELAGVLGVFLGKVKNELASSQVREKQRGQAEARWWQTILTTIVSKQHHAIVVDEDNTVLYTNFPVTGTATPDGKTHLLDVIDTQAQDVLRLVGVALDRPNQVVETDTMFRSQPCHVRAVHLAEEGELRRTLLLFIPKPVGAARLA